MKKVYLAGPDVFRVDSIEWGRHLKQLCHEAGLEGLYPLDNEISHIGSPYETARAIALANMNMIRQADGVVANLQWFRGKEPDSGTAFEVGAAIALNKPVWAYFPEQGSLKDQIETDKNGFDADGLLVEDFGLPRNLMMASQWAGCSHSVQEAIWEMAHVLK
ncbi:MAG: nucleoside 2-deoxyribosyltransferase [Pusillimonas sp.]|jgi:nucleoside 2-deoxyribosyltransferase|nr:nucleoside 2-deoxyribosyltransferase [Pusillimonas sp.]